MKLLFCFTCSLLLLTSCLTTRQTNLLQEGDGKGQAVTETEALAEYKICIGDVLYISVRSLNPETNALFNMFSAQNQASATSGTGLTSFTVYPDGTIDFPYLDPVSVKGMTTLEVKLLMENKLKVVMKECAVQVSLGNRFFSVIGEAGVGRYPIVKEKTTIYQALAQAKDIHPYGDRTKVRIVRYSENGTLIKTFDIRSEDVVNSEYYYIQPNDVIYIQPLGRQFIGIDSFGALFAILSTFLSVGLMVFNFVK